MRQEHKNELIKTLDDTLDELVGLAVDAATANTFDKFKEIEQKVEAVRQDIIRSFAKLCDLIGN